MKLIAIYILPLFLFLLGLINWRYFNISLSGRQMEIRSGRFFQFLRWVSVISGVGATSCFIFLMIFEGGKGGVFNCFLVQLVASFALLFGTVKRFVPIPDDELERLIAEDIESGNLDPFAEE